MESEIRIRRQMIEIGKRIYQSGMVAANDGNLSVRISENEILCTPTGISKGYMTEECLCKINLQGEVLSCQDGFRPSSEMKMHLKVYEKRPDVRAVVHAHPPYATTFAIGGQALNRAIISESYQPRIHCKSWLCADSRIWSAVYAGNTGCHCTIS